jgi:hypothetical protein
MEFIKMPIQSNFKKTKLLFPPLFFLIGLTLMGCQSSLPMGSWTVGKQSDKSLTHTALVMENPNPKPITITMKKRGLKITTIIIPPLSLYRTLIPSGHWIFEVVQWKKKTVAVLKSKTRYFIKFSKSE